MVITGWIIHKKPYESEQCFNCRFAGIKNGDLYCRQWSRFIMTHDPACEKFIKWNDKVITK